MWLAEPHAWPLDYDHRNAWGADQGAQQLAQHAAHGLQVKVTSSTKHLATVVEVFAMAPDPSSSVASGATGATIAGICRTPTATAHSVNLEQLPAPAALRHAALAAVALDAAAAERALVVRSGDEDWAVLIGVPRAACCASSQQDPAAE